MHAVLALSMALLRMLGASDELTTDNGLPLGSSDLGRGLALVLLLGCVVALVLVARDSWSTRRSWPSWMLGALLLWSLWNTQGMHGPDILYLGAALCAFAASRPDSGLFTRHWHARRAQSPYGSVHTLEPEAG
jgi:hypothetical protein